ncbi:MAG TPA: hypothetical protein VIM73_10595 [Polyangiaceae bacterium]
MRWLGSLMAVGFISFSLVACSDDDNDGDPGDSPAEKCEDALSVLCDRVVTCRTEANQLMGATPEEAHQACLTAQRKAMSASGTNCGKATGLRPSYDLCLSELPSVACSTVLDPAAGYMTAAPSVDSCKSILYFRQ